MLGGTGTVRVSVDGRPTQTVAVGGEPKLYQLVGSSRSLQALLTLAVSPGGAGLRLHLRLTPRPCRLRADLCPAAPPGTDRERVPAPGGTVHLGAGRELGVRLTRRPRTVTVTSPGERPVRASPGTYRSGPLVLPVENPAPTPLGVCPVAP